MKNFNDLSEREVLALAISLEEEDERVYADFSEGLRQEYPGSAAVFDSMRTEESGHRRRLIDLYKARFGDHIPLIRRQDVKGFVARRPIWLNRPLGLAAPRGTLEVGHSVEGAEPHANAQPRHLGPDPLDDRAQEARAVLEAAAVAAVSPPAVTADPPSEAAANGAAAAAKPSRPRRRRSRAVMDAASIGLPPKPEKE